MMLGLIRPTGGRGAALRPGPDRRPGRRAGRASPGSSRSRRSTRTCRGRAEPRDAGDARRRRREPHRRACCGWSTSHHRAGDRVRGYSHGMRQRLGLAGGAPARAAPPAPRRADDRPRPGRHARHARRWSGGWPATGITILLSTHLMSEVEQLCNRLAIIQLGRIRYEGDARRPPRPKRRPLPARRHRCPRAARHLPRDRRHPRRHRATTATCGSRPSRDAAATVSLRAGRGGDRRARARARRAEPRGALLRDHRGRGRDDPAGATRGRCASSRRSGGRTSASAPRSSRRSSSSSAIKVRPPQPTDPGIAVLPALRGRVRAGRAAPDAALRLGLALPAGRGARRRRHRRRRGRQPHAEDDPDPVGRPQRDLRRQGRSGVHVRPRGAPRRWSSPASLAGGIASGFDPLPTFSTVVSPSRALLLIAGSFAVYSLPALAIAAIARPALDGVAETAPAAVVGTLLAALLMQLTQIIPVLDSDAAQRWMLTTQLQAWQALFRTPLDWGPVVHAAYISLVYAVPALVVAWAHFLRRDVAG